MKLFQLFFGKMNKEEPRQEFTGMVKLIGGEELIGKILVDEEVGGYIIDSPFLVKSHVITTPHGDMFKVDLIPWMKFSKDEICFLTHDKVYAVSECEDRIGRLYKTTLKKYYNGIHPHSNKVALEKEDGNLGSVETTRASLEKIYKSNS